MAKSLIKFSMLMKNVSRFSKCISTTRYYSNSSSIKVSTAEAIGDTKIEEPTLYQKLIDDSDLSRLMENLEANKSNLESHYTVVALKTMYSHFKKNGQLTTEVHNNEHFLKMCSILSQHLTSLTLQQLLQSLKILNFLKVSSLSMLVQSILQLIRTSINDLSLTDIYYLAYLFEQMEPSPLSNAINTALPRVFISQLYLKLDKDDIKELKKALSYASHYVNNDETIQYILDAMHDNLDPIDLDTAIDILSALLMIHNKSRSYNELLYRVQNIIINESGQLYQKKVVNVLIRTPPLIMKGFENYYNTKLLDKLIDYIIIDNCNFAKGTLILNELNKLKYINIPLLQYLSRLCCDDPSILSKCSPLAMSTLVTGLSFANLKPDNWTELQEHIINNCNRISDNVMYCYLALRLVGLDCVNPKLLSYVFGIDQKLHLMTYHYHQALKRLYQIVKLLHPTYLGPWPSQEVIDSFRESKSKKVKDTLLLPTLNKIFSDPSLIKTELRTQFGHEIDYLIVKQDNSPIAVQSKNSDSTTFVEDLIIPPNSRKIILQVLPNNAFGKNIPRMDATFSACLKSLEALSFEVVYMSYNKWDSMSSYERIPYLNHLLK